MSNPKTIGSTSYKGTSISHSGPEGGSLNRMTKEIKQSKDNNGNSGYVPYVSPEDNDDIFTIYSDK